MSFLVSVIIPIYKVEKYLNECIDSIINQSYTNLEIILVDDGSPDACGKICDEYALKDTRIKVIHKPNGGLSDARNAGLDVAAGEYISFVDSDDIIHYQFIETLLNSLLNTNSTISFCNRLRFTNSKDINIQNESSNINNTFDGAEFINLIYHKQWYPKNVIACNKIYHKNIFKTIRFKKGLIHEDEYIFTDIYSQPNLKIVYTNNSLYFHRITEGSIMNSSFSVQKFNSLVKLWRKRAKFLKNKNKNYYYVSIYNLHNNYIKGVDEGMEKEVIKSLSFKRYIQILINRNISSKIKIKFSKKLINFLLKKQL